MKFIEESELKNGEYTKRMSSLSSEVNDDYIKELLGCIDRIGGIREDVLEFIEAHSEMEINRTVKEIYMKFLNNPDEISADWYELVNMAYKRKEPEKLPFFCQSILFAISKQIPPDIVKTGLLEFDTPYQLSHYLKEYLKKHNKSTASEDEEKIIEAINALAENLDIIVSQKEASEETDRNLLNLVKEQSEEIKSLRKEQKEKFCVNEKSKEKEVEAASYYKKCYKEINEKLKKAQNSLTVSQLENKELKKDMERKEAQNKEFLSEIYETINQLQKKNKSLEEEVVFLKKALDEARNIKSQFEYNKNKTVELGKYAALEKEAANNDWEEEDMPKETTNDNWEEQEMSKEVINDSRAVLEALKEASNDDWEESKKTTYFAWEEPDMPKDTIDDGWEEPQIPKYAICDGWEEPQMPKDTIDDGWEESKMPREVTNNVWEKYETSQKTVDFGLEESKMLKPNPDKTMNDEKEQIALIDGEKEKGIILLKSDSNTSSNTNKQKKINIKGAVSEKINRIVFFSEIVTSARRKKFEKLSGGRQTEAIYKLMIKNKFDSEKMDSVVNAMKEGVSKEFIYEMIHKNPSMDEMYKMQSFFEKAIMAQV